MQPESTPQEFYRTRLGERAVEVQRLEARKTTLGYVRLVTVAAVLACIWGAIKTQTPAWLTVIPVLVFIGLVWKQSKVERAAEVVRRAIRFYERGVARVEHRWQGGGEAGDRFLDAHHPYASDLDLFGRGGLFELLSTARTRGGEAKLADWLRGRSQIDELRARHAAVTELRPLLDLREQLAVIGEDVRAGVNPDHLKNWAAVRATPFPTWMRLTALSLAILSAAMLVWWFATGFIGIEARRAVLVIGLLDGAFALSVRARVLGIIFAIHEPAHDLDRFAEILAVIESHQFQSERLRTLRAAVGADAEPASRSIARLRRWMELLDSRDNVFLRIFGPPLLWTTQLAMAVENWRAKHGPFVAAWLDAVSEIEALAALANYAYEHPTDPFPVFVEGAVFDGEALGHPLLPDDRCVRNSVSLREPVRLMVISGSNMSGKSTLLRAVGVNAVLALAGAPVRAKRLAISAISLGASIRTMDSLEEGHSRFMAEILRLKQILELPQPALFLLDELLHGTNSHDRAIGAEGLIRALIARGAIGLASTHDLSLATVADSMAPAGINVHFDDRLEDGKLVFDYSMKPGVVDRSNALDLMRAVGLDV